MWFENYHQQDNHKSIDAANFKVQTNSETCKGCGLCTKRCPMEVLSMASYKDADASLNKKAQVPKLISEDCLGCGVCVVKCPTKSLKLVAKATVIDTPKDAREWSTRYMTDVKAGVRKKKAQK